MYGDDQIGVGMGYDREVKKWLKENPLKPSKPARDNSQISGRTQANTYGLPAKHSELNTCEGQHITLFSMEVFVPHSSSTHSTVSIADTHNTHNAQTSLPGGDILLHTGDLTQLGTLPELCDALAWLSVQPHLVKIFIGGNHDGALAEHKTRTYICQAYPALTYLENDFVQVTLRHHTLHIYGSPYNPQYGT
ncbi:hypothetical protein EV363DRAFT_1568884 [Boletus edulis]|nr:hypothetical protein EV363DRAFT_1568884 [Boletus edulis]